MKVKCTVHTESHHMIIVSKQSCQHQHQCQHQCICHQHQCIFAQFVFGHAEEKGSITTKAANKPEKAVLTTKKVVDKNDSILKVVNLLKTAKLQTMK